MSNEMTNEEANKVLEEMHQVRPEVLNDKAKRLFEAIMKIADDRDKAYRIIDEMVEEYEYNARINLKNFCEDEMRKDKCIQDCKTCVIKYFEERCK